MAFNRSRKVPAQESPAFGAIAERFRRGGDLERAVSLCQEGLGKFPNHLSARVTLGWSLLDLGRYDEARAELEQVLRVAPDNLAAIRGLAELHDRTEHDEVAAMQGGSRWGAADASFQPPEPASALFVPPESEPALSLPVPSSTSGDETVSAFADHAADSSLDMSAIAPQESPADPVEVEFSTERPAPAPAVAGQPGAIVNGTDDHASLSLERAAAEADATGALPTEVKALADAHRLDLEADDAIASAAEAAEFGISRVRPPQPADAHLAALTDRAAEPAGAGTPAAANLGGAPEPIHTPSAGGHVVGVAAKAHAEPAADAVANQTLADDEDEEIRAAWAALEATRQLEAETHPADSVALDGASDRTADRAAHPAIVSIETPAESAMRAAAPVAAPDSWDLALHREAAASSDAAESALVAPIASEPAPIDETPIRAEAVADQLHATEEIEAAPAPIEARQHVEAPQPVLVHLEPASPVAAPAIEAAAIELDAPRSEAVAAPTPEQPAAVAPAAAAPSVPESTAPPFVAPWSPNLAPRAAVPMLGEFADIRSAAQAAWSADSALDFMDEPVEDLTAAVDDGPGPWPPIVEDPVPEPAVPLIAPVALTAPTAYHRADVPRDRVSSVIGALSRFLRRIESRRSAAMREYVTR